MAYAEAQDVIDRYGEAYLLRVADRDLDGVADTDALKSFDDASSEIDSYLAVKSVVPLTTVPDLIVAMCADIAVYKMASGPGGGLTDEITARYKNAIAWLRDYARGSVSLGLPDPSGSAISSPQVSTSNPERLFTRTTMRGLW